MNKSLEKYRKVQSIAKTVLTEIECHITENVSEKEIASICKKLLENHGINKTWYYDCPALVLLGSRSCTSISGREYVPSDEKVGKNNLITIDLSPLDNEIWGDCSRSFVVEDGKIKKLESMQSKEFLDGIKTEEKLHKDFKNYVKSGMTFEEVYQILNSKIAEYGYINLDFMGNVGHTIETDRNDRLYFEKGNTNKLTDDMLFTFEPHISTSEKKWGFKCENIYYFGKDKKIEEL